MKVPSSSWHPLRWVYELTQVWRDTRQIVLVAQIAAIYAAILIPFKVGIPLIPGFAELRPANAIPIVASLLFGPAAAWGAGIGNMIADCFGTLGPASLFGFFGNFLLGYVPYLLWGNMGPLSSGEEPIVKSWRQGLEFVVVCLVASCICAATIGWGVELLGLLPFVLLAPLIFFNNVIMGLLLGPPLLLFLYPRVKRWGLRYVDLRSSGEFPGLRSDTQILAGPSEQQMFGQEAIRDEPFISVRDLTFRYKDAERPVLSQLSLDINQGESVVLMGRSGSGKSTLCYAMNGLIPQFVAGQFSGSVKVDGKDSTRRHVWEQAGTVGMVFQDFETQLISTNVERELRYPLENGDPSLRPQDPETMTRRIQGTLRLVGLTGLEQRDPLTLSGGQRQRLVVGSVLVQEPAVVVMDQPMTDLDPAGRKRLIQLLHRLRHEGITLILAEHDSEEALWADRICLLDQGKVAWAGPPRDLLGQPALATKYGIRPFPLAQCFSGLDLPTLPATVEEAWQLADEHGLRVDPPPELGPVQSHQKESKGSPLQGTSGFRLEQVSFVYEGGIQALKKFSVSVSEGEFVAVLGENGSGKSTFAKLLNGLLLPTEGRVLVEELDTKTASMSQLASLVGHVFQNPDHQIFAETVWNEVAFGPQNMGCPLEECQQRVAAALEAVGLCGAGEQDPFSLTKGERQRVAVASVLAARPRILIFDEPTTGLDAEESRRMMEMIKQFNRQGHTIIMITHTMWLAAEYATRCLLMKDGQLIGDGPTRGIFSDSALVESASLEVPALSRFTQRWGHTLLTVEEVRASLKRS